MQVQPAAKRINARLEFSFVYPDKRGRNVMRPVGTSQTPAFVILQPACPVVSWALMSIVCPDTCEICVGLNRSHVHQACGLFALYD